MRNYIRMVTANFHRNGGNFNGFMTEFEVDMWGF